MTIVRLAALILVLALVAGAPPAFAQAPPAVAAFLVFFMNLGFAGVAITRATRRRRP